jgi:hypothetical protein
MTTNNPDSSSPTEEPTEEPIEELNPEELQLVRDSLTSFSRYIDAEPVIPMPDGVWEQIHTSLSLESANPVTDLAEHRQRRLGTKWVGGLVAASVTLLAVGIGANVLSTDESASIDSGTVMADAPKVLDQSPDAPTAEAATQVIQAGFVPPAVTITASGADYSPQNLTKTVTQALNKVGVKSPIDYFRVPVQKMSMSAPSGMLKSETALRNCITELTKSETSQALLVDQGTYLGKEAGIVVIPFAMVKGMDSVPESAARFAVGQAILDSNRYLSFLDIWIVGPGCGTVPFEVYSHTTYSLN